VPTVTPADSAPDVVAVLAARVAELHRTQINEDVAGFLSLFDEEAVWVTGGGVRLVGLDAISKFTGAVLPGAFSDGSAVSYEVVHVSFLGDDVVLTSVDQQYYDAGGNAVSAGRPTYVWRYRHGTWSIVAGQNTAVGSE
jgi:uncharacterized protein (TIGR02246 family)